MKTNFWIEDKSPKQVFEEFLLSENPEAKFWDIFNNYNPDYSILEPADVSKNWLQKQNKIVDEIIQNHFSQTQLNQNEIALLIEAIEEYTLPEEDQYPEDLYSKFKEIAKNIAQNYILPLQLNPSTIINLIDTLEDELEKRNASHIIENNKEALRQSVRLKGMKGEYTKEKVEEILQGFEKMWSTETEFYEPAYEEIEEDEEEDEEAMETDDFDYPRIPLAYSNTFYGFDDAGNLSYQEQEEYAKKKFEQYRDEISELLTQKPDNALQPKLDDVKLNTNKELEVAYWQTIETNPFMYNFEGYFAVWKGEEKVLFLSVLREDKELPYEIHLGGLSLEKYSEILNTFNNITG